MPPPSPLNPPRVLLTCRAGIGGAAAVVERMLIRLPERGIGGTAVLSSLEGERLMDVATANGWDVARLDLRREIAPLADAAAAFRLRRLCHGHDLVHAHTAKPGALARLALGGNRPVVYAPHGFYFTYHEPGSREHRRYLQLERRLASRTTLVHCVSDSERDVAVAEGLVEPERAVVLRNPLPDAPEPLLPALVRDRLRSPHNWNLILCAMRLASPKDPETLVRAMALLPEDVRACLVFVGDGPLREPCEALAAELAPDRIRFAGTRDDVRALLPTADVAVLPTTSEALPTFLLEAAAAGVPAVATDLPGCHDASGDAALYVAPGDPEGMASALSAVLATPSLHMRLRAAASARSNLFDEDRWLDGLVRMYDRALDRDR